MEKIKLDQRLLACAQFVRKGSRLADIGTDHAYLPTYLVQSGKISLAYACDINENPLQSAKETIQKYGVQDQIELRLCNGLERIEKQEIDDIVIAGMGGELIIEILSACDYIKSENLRHILQPMSKAHLLRRFLCENGFEILDETACASNGKIYTVLCCEYTGETGENNDKFYYFGRLIEKTDEYSEKYKQKIKNSILKQANGILKSRPCDKHAKELLNICEKI